MQFFQNRQVVDQSSQSSLTFCTLSPKSLVIWTVAALIPPGTGLHPTTWARLPTFTKPTWFVYTLFKSSLPMTQTSPHQTGSWNTAFHHWIQNFLHSCDHLTLGLTLLLPAVCMIEKPHHHVPTRPFKHFLNVANISVWFPKSSRNSAWFRVLLFLQPDKSRLVISQHSHFTLPSTPPPPPPELRHSQKRPLHSQRKRNCESWFIS